jgi:hypothetical protein
MAEGYVARPPAATGLVQAVDARHHRARSERPEGDVDDAKVGWQNVVRFVGLNGGVAQLSQTAAIRLSGPATDRDAEPAIEGVERRAREYRKRALDALDGDDQGKERLRSEVRARLDEGTVGTKAKQLSRELRKLPRLDAEAIERVRKKVSGDLTEEIAELDVAILAHLTARDWSPREARDLVAARKAAHVVTLADQKQYPFARANFLAAARSLPIVAPPKALTRPNARRADEPKQDLQEREGSAALRAAIAEEDDGGESDRGPVEDARPEARDRDRNRGLLGAAAAFLRRRFTASEDARDAGEEKRRDGARSERDEWAVNEEEDHRDAGASPRVDRPVRRRALIGGLMVDVGAPRAKGKEHKTPVVAPAAPKEPVQAATLRPQVYSADLIVVRERLKDYELVDFSHIENVLAGEHKERRHRRLERVETELLERTESEETNERESQTTDRNELQVEAERAIQTEFEARASLSVSGSYGPSVKFTAEAEVGFSRSTAETTRRAETHAREVVERTMERVVRRNLREMRRRTLQEIEETNEHGLDNRGGDQHVSGIYRWLNKICEVQLWNLGQRTMVELVLPEPSANYRDLLASDPPEGAAILEQPLAPTHPDDPARPLTPRSPWIDQEWGDLAHQYRVTGLTPPPSGTIVKAATASGTSDGDPIIASGMLAIDDGWETEKFCVRISRSRQDNDNWYVNVRVGNHLFETTDDSWRDVGQYTKEVPWVVLARYCYAYTANIMASCRPTAAAKNAWRATVYDAIMDAYTRQKREYDDRLRVTVAAEVERRREGAHPVELERTVRDELQRAFIAMLVRDNLRGFNSFTNETGADIAFAAADEDMPKIAFLQQAFEWENMNYVFYPYFWGRESKWGAVVDVAEGDSLFASFLKAGAARVQVPVRPEYEALVRNWLTTGLTWPGDEIIYSDGENVTITEEQVEELGSPPEGVPMGDPWEVRLPTSLVLLRDPSQIEFRDALALSSLAAAGLPEEDKGETTVAAPGQKLPQQDEA